MSDLTIPHAPRAHFILLASVFVVAACGLAYELVAGTVSSYILGDAVTQFSLVIGVFLSAMGVGSYLARFVRTRLLQTFIDIEIAVGLIGGLSSISMLAISVYLDDLFAVVFYGLCAAIGILIGVEIPLLVRIVKGHSGYDNALSSVLAIDYLGALVGSIVFPLLILPWLGLSRASVVFGLMNIGVAGAGLILLEHRRRRVAWRLVMAGLVLVAALLLSTRLVGYLEDLLYQDRIVYAETTPYQRIVLTRWQDDLRLYLNGHIQFCSIDEARYHEALVLPALSACARPGSVLILGGGDGLAAREVLKFSSVRRIVLVDIDPAMVQLARRRPELVALNAGALNSDKVRVVTADAMQYLADSRDFFDVILVDLPDPNSEAMAKLYSTAFYALCARRLTPAGVLVTQATSPFFAPEAFWCIAATLEAALDGGDGAPGLAVRPYHVHVPSFGEWGFVLASRRAMDPDGLRVTVPTRFMTDGTLKAMFSFGLDLQAPAPMPANRLDNPAVYHYYQKGWREFNQ